MAKAPSPAQALIRRQAAPDWSCATILLYGAPGVGKTTVALGAPAPLVLDIEGGVKAYTGDVASVRTLAELDMLITYLAREPHPYETIVLDGLDALYALAFTEINGDREVKDRRLLHVIPGERLGRIVRRLCDLPMLKLITAHSRDEYLESEEHSKRRPHVIDIALPGQFRDRVKSMLDVCAYCWRSGGGPRSMQADPHVRERAQVWAKDRTGALVRPAPLSWTTLQKGLGL